MLEHLLRQYGYLVVYFGTLFEPDATLISATFLAHRGYLHIGLVWFVATVSTVSMSQFWFWLGRNKGRDLIDKMSEKNRRYARIRRWISRRGDVLVFFARFLWGLRLAITSACGASGFSPLRFAAIDMAGAILWTALIGTVGFAIAQAIGRAFRHLRRYEDVIALGLLGAVALVAMWRRSEATEEIKTLAIHPEEIGVEALAHVERVIHPAEPD
jgi:membrane protein DedA with SNARE-associated domain